MKPTYLILASVFVLSPLMAAEDILFACRSKVPVNETHQLYGTLANEGILNSRYVRINIWDEKVKPAVVSKKEWAFDLTYQPRADKYKDYLRYIISKNDSKNVGYDVLIPSKESLWTKAIELLSKQSPVQVPFQAVLRYRDDYQSDTGGQEYLDCHTGWLSLKN